MRMPETNREQLPRRRLPNSAKYVLTYLKMRHLVYCEETVSFKDIVEGTGLSPRTVRKVLSVLKKADLLKVTYDVKNGRRNLYQLNMKRALSCFKRRSKLISPGVYFVDVGLGVRKFLSPRALAAILSCNYAIVTDSVPEQITELIPEDITLMHISSVLNDEFDIARLSSDDLITVVLYDSLLDCSSINALAKRLNSAGMRNVFYVSSVSPVDYALHLLELGKRCRVKFRRTPISLEIYVRRVPRREELNGNIVRVYYLKYSCKGGFVELSLTPVDLLVHSIDSLNVEDSAVIVYLQYT